MNVSKKLTTRARVKPEWVERAQLYGFHQTICYPIDFNTGQLQSIEQDVEGILQCFNLEHHFTLTLRDDAFSLTNMSKPYILLRYTPNDHYKIFHTLMVTLAQKYGTGSFYIERYYNNPAQYEQSFRVNKILRFYNYPYILDEWEPHFTLLSSYKQDENRHDIIQFITEQFKEYNKIVVETTCLLIQTRNGGFWKIHTEFTR